MQKVRVKRCTGGIWAKSHHTPPVPPSQSLNVEEKELSQMDKRGPGTSHKTMYDAKVGGANPKNGK